MTEKTLSKKILDVLAGVAPEAATRRLDPETNFRDQLDFDSVDFLTFALRLSEELQVEIPETDYPRLSSLVGCLSYLESRAETVS